MFRGDTIGLNTLGGGAGAVAIANGGVAGVEIYNMASSNTIGGAGSAGNLISGNTRDGIAIYGALTTANAVAGDTIGLNMAGGGAGTAAIPNGGAAGVEVFRGASSNTIGGTGNLGDVISGNTGDGVQLHDQYTTGNTVLGDMIGTDATGSNALPNGGNGVTIASGAASNTIGGTESGEGDLISGNTGDGVDVSGTGTSQNNVEGNRIGTNVSGTVALSNVIGVNVFSSATNNTIGGTEAGAGNLISGNSTDGVDVSGAGSSQNDVEGNFIGTDASGTLALGNMNGVQVFNAASGNTIGGTEAGAGNEISGNGGTGVAISGANTSQNNVEGNIIGVVALGNGVGVQVFGGATGNTIGGTEAGAPNVISGNANDGVDIYGAGTSQNSVEGNDIGTDASGSVADSNLNGVQISSGASGNTIGGAEAALATSSRAIRATVLPSTRARARTRLRGTRSVRMSPGPWR